MLAPRTPTIRVARADDERALRAIELATWSPAVSPAPPRAAKEPFYRGLTRVEDTLVAVLDGEPVGFLKLAPVSPLAATRHVLEIHGFAVDPAHHRRGIGRRLLEAARVEAARQDARRLTLRVLASNPDAERLYTAFGFAVEGRLRGEYRLAGRYVDDVLMALEMSGA